jgi:hypothetical protein
MTLTQLRVELERYTKLYAVMGIESAGNDAAETQKKIKASEKRLEAAQRKVDASMSVQTVKFVAKKFAAAFRDFGKKTIPEQKALLQEHFESIHIRFGRVEALNSKDLTPLGKAMKRKEGELRLVNALFGKEVDQRNAWLLEFKTKPQYPAPYKANGINSSSVLQSESGSCPAWY